MINKIFPSAEKALADLKDGATIMIGSFGGAGMPNELLAAVIAHGAKDLTIVNNNAGNGETGLAALMKAGRVRKIICSFPRQADSHVFDTLYLSKKIELLVEKGEIYNIFFIIAIFTKSIPPFVNFKPIIFFWQLF